MADLAAHQTMNFAFDNLLAELAATWAGPDVEYVRDIVEHAEYRDALENLVALGDASGRGFSGDHLRRIEGMAVTLGTTVAAVRAENQSNQQVGKLQSYGSPRRGASAA